MINSPSAQTFHVVNKFSFLTICASPLIDKEVASSRQAIFQFRASQEIPRSRNDGQKGLLCNRSGVGEYSNPCAILVRAMKVLMLVEGIGRATAIRMAETGATGLALSDLNLDDLEETAKLCKQ